MNNCPNCGQEIGQTQGQVTNCPDCGTSLEATAEVGSEETSESEFAESSEDQ